WATWCGPCRSEMPEIVKAYEKHKDEGLVILAVNVEEGPQEVKEFTNTFKMTFPITLDTKGKVIDAYGVRAMPTSLFVDSQGIIRARWQGALTGDQLEEHLRTILP
ncbi:MAG: redoxin domain-containing protein, partial [Anaerolineae bacterium]|nr:redoxin domain-containing protein [Anaerolineae bacterium]